MHQIVFSFFIFISLASEGGRADTRRCNVNSDGCTCPNGTFLFDGDCHTPKNYGEDCYSVHQCLRGNKHFGDPFIACYKGMCLCRPGTVIHEGRCRNLTTLPPPFTMTVSEKTIVSEDGVDNVSLKASVGTTPTDVENATTVLYYPEKKKKQPSQLSNMTIGSIAFILLSILLIASCFCFWSLGRFILLSIYSSPRTISIPDDHSLPTHHKFYDDIFDDLDIGQDNPCFLVDKRRPQHCHDEHTNESTVSGPEWIKISFEKERSTSAPDGDEVSHDEIYNEAFHSSEQLKYIDDTTDDAGTQSTMRPSSRCPSASSSSEGEVI